MKFLLKIGTNYFCCGSSKKIQCQITGVRMDFLTNGAGMAEGPFSDKGGF